MLLSGASQRGSKRAVLSSRNLQYKRRFSFLPYSRRFGLARIIRLQRKGLPDNPFHLLFSRPRDSGGLQQQRRVWGRRWEYEDKNGVVNETSSEYVPGKGWVEVDPGRSKVEDLNNNEEFDIDLITLRRVPKAKAAEKPLQKHDTTRENQNLSLSESCGKVESTANANPQRPPIEPLPTEEPSEPLPPRKSTKERAKKSQKSDLVDSEPAGVPGEPPFAPLEAASRKDKKETSPIDSTPSKSSLASSKTAMGMTQETSPGSLPVGLPKTSKASSNEVSPKEAMQVTQEELSALKDVESGKKAKIVSSKEKNISEPKDRRSILDEILNDQKQAPEKMTPPPLPSEPVKSDWTVTDVLGTLERKIQELEAIGKWKPPSAAARAEQSEGGSDPATSSNVMTNKKSPSSPPKLTEPLNMKAGGSAKSGAKDSKKATENAVLSKPVSVTTRDTSTGFADSKGAASMAEDVSRPIPLMPTEPLGKSESTVAKSLAPNSAQTLKKRSPSLPVPAKSNVRGSSATPSNLATPQLEPAEPVLHSGSGVVTDAKAVNSAGKPGKSIPSRSSDPAELPNVVADTATTVANTVASARPSSEIRKGSPVPSFFANDSVTGILEEVRGAATPLAPGSPAKETFKYHKLNIANRPGEDLGLPDADVDILLPSDVRAAAGAPGKIVTRTESTAEKQQRWAKLVEEFEADYKREKAEPFEISSGVRRRILHSLGTARIVSNKRTDGDVASKHQSSEKSSKSSGPRSPEENEDYHWSGTENVSAEDVLGIKPPTNQPQALASTLGSAAQQTVLEADGRPSRSTSSPAVFKFFVLVRDPESGNIQCAALPQGMVSDAMTRANTAFDSLQNLDSPESFLPLWRVLQKGGFTVVGGEKDCLVVKVDAEVARAKQELVLKEIKLKLSPAESVARESWERKRRMNRPETGKELETAEDIVATITSQPRPAEAQDTIPSTVSTRLEPKSKPESVTTHQEIGEVTKGEKSAEILSEVQGSQPKESRPFRRVFWAAVWVAACSGAVSAGLEGYL